MFDRKEFYNRGTKVWVTRFGGEYGVVAGFEAGHYLVKFEWSSKLVRIAPGDVYSADPSMMARAEKLENDCNCELRDRQWDPNTGHCKFCGQRYRESR